MRTRMRRFNGGQRFRDPRSLFMDGSDGFWLDMTDPSTWFQNSDGTTPATTLGDPVGFVMDKSGKGYNAIQATSTARPTHGRMPYGGVRNQVTYSEDPSNAVWGKTRVTYAAGSLAETVDVGGHALTATGIVTAAGSKKYVSYWLEKGDLAAAPDWIQITTGTSGFVATDAYRVNFNLTTMEVGATGGAVSETSITEDEGYIRIRAAITAASTVSSASIALAFTNNADSGRQPSYAGNVLANVFVHRIQVEDNGYTDYQKVVQAYDVTEAGVVSVPCLWFDGVDDFLNLTTGKSLARNASSYTGVASFNITSSASASRTFFSFTTNVSNQVRVYLNRDSSGDYSFSGRRLDSDTSQVVAGPQLNSFTNKIASGVWNWQDAVGQSRLNGEVVASSDPFQTPGLTSDTDSSTAYIGRFNTLYYGGFIGGCFGLRNIILTDVQLASLEGYFMNQIGVAA